LQASDDKIRLREEAIAAHERDPEGHPMPEPEQDYEFFLVDNQKDAANLKRKYDIMDPEKDDEDLYTFSNGAGQKCFRFKKIRTYETAATTGSVDVKYDEEIVVAVNNGSDEIHQRAAFYYPLVQRATIRPQRKKNIDRQRWGFTDVGNEEADTVDLLDVSIRDATEQEEKERKVWIDSPYHVFDAGEEYQDDDQERGGREGDDELEDIDGQLRRENGGGNESD
jgi:RNA polymerase II-associated factor 1